MDQLSEGTGICYVREVLRERCRAFECAEAGEPSTFHWLTATFLLAYWRFIAS
jgi:hypothetical protein